MYLEQNDPLSSLKQNNAWLILLGILVVYLLLIIPTMGRLGIGWDEATDLAIAQSYQTPKGILLGHSWDPSQMRLPMFTVAMVFQILGTESLIIARFTTVLVGGLTLLAIFVYGRERFHTVTGLLATGLVAISPFFLSFARLAFTEGDLYLACALIWFLISISRAQESPSMKNALWSGFFLGCCISAKATAVFIIPGMFAAILFHYIKYRPSIQLLAAKHNSISILTICLWSVYMIAMLVIGVLVSRQLDIGNHPAFLRLINYLVLFLGWAIALYWALRLKDRTAQPVALFIFIASFGILTSFLVPPENLVNSEIIHTLMSRAENELAFSFSSLMEHALMHLFILFLKSTPFIGLGILVGSVISLVHWHRPAFTLPLAIVGTYLIGILLLPLTQTFYTIPLLPILTTLAAEQLRRLYIQRRKLSISLIMLGLGWWGIEITQCYPDFHLNGYQWLGERPFLGRSSIGYRSIVYIPSDGVQQGVEWLNKNAESGQVAQLYVGPWHIVEAIASDDKYTISDGRLETLEVIPDFVVIHIGATILQGEGVDAPTDSIFQHPYNLDVLYRNYEKVFSVKRAFDLEMASVWKRK